MNAETALTKWEPLRWVLCQAQIYKPKIMQTRPKKWNSAFISSTTTDMLSLKPTYWEAWRNLPAFAEKISKQPRWEDCRRAAQEGYGVSLEGWGANWVQLPQIKMGNEILHPQPLQVCFVPSEDSHEFPPWSATEANNQRACKMNIVLNMQHALCSTQRCLAICLGWGENLQKSHKPLNV